MVRSIKKLVFLLFLDSNLYYLSFSPDWRWTNRTCIFKLLLKCSFSGDAYLTSPPTQRSFHILSYFPPILPSLLPSIAYLCFVSSLPHWNICPMRVGVCHLGCMTNHQPQTMCNHPQSMLSKFVRWVNWGPKRQSTSAGHRNKVGLGHRCRSDAVTISTVGHLFASLPLSQASRYKYASST